MARNETQRYGCDPGASPNSCGVCDLPLGFLSAFRQNPFSVCLCDTPALLSCPASCHHPVNYLTSSRRLYICIPLSVTARQPPLTKG